MNNSYTESNKIAVVNTIVHKYIDDILALGYCPTTHSIVILNPANDEVYDD